MNPKAKPTARLSVEQIIDHVRTTRNELIKEFLEDRQAKQYFEEKFGRTLSNVKIEFLKRDLRELLIAPVDLVHYSRLITELKEAKSITGLSEKSDQFFMTELDKVFQKYCF